METIETTAEIKRPPMRSIYHLRYSDCEKVIGFINRNNTGKIESDYAWVSVGKVGTQVTDENWPAVIDFLNELDVRYEVMDAKDQTLLAKSNGSLIVDRENGIIKPQLPILCYGGVTKEQFQSLLQSCITFNQWLKTQRARDILSNKKRKDCFTDNNYIIKRCKEELAK